MNQGDEVVGSFKSEFGISMCYLTTLRGRLENS